MKKKGFTLVELLAVIVILAVIALIATPTILGVIDKAKRSSLQDSGYGLVEAANLYYAQYQNSKTVRFDIDDNKITTEEKNKLNYKGTIKSGTVLINKKGQVTVCINDGKHAAYKNYKDSKVIVVDSKTCTIPENKYIVYLDDEATITEMTNQELTDAVTNLIEQVNILKQENAQLKQQVNNKSDSTQVSTLQLRHDNDITSIWNKVGTEDLSSISDGSISQILIDNNKLVSDLQTLVNGKVDATVTNNLSSQISTLNSTVSSQATRISNLSSQLSTLSGNVNSAITTINSAISSNSTSIESINNKLGDFKLIYHGIISKNKNLLLEEYSMYLLVSMQDVNGVESNPYVMLIGTGSSNITLHHVISGTTTSWSLFPTSGLTQGLYPISGAYIHTSVYKIY